MSALDDALGRGPLTAAPAESVPTNWPKAEERLRPLLDAWDDEMRYPRWTPFERKRILAGARDFAALTCDPEVLREAMSRMRNHGLTLTSPRSCITIGRQVLDARARFTSHLADDPIEELATFECSKCKQTVYNEAALTMDCLHHFQDRKDYYAWKGVAE